MKFLKRVFVFLSFATLTMQFSCAPTPEPRLQIGSAYAIDGVRYHPEIQPKYKEIGYASWYGKRFNKKRTANGEIFDMHDYTAAHKTLPLPSVVRVTNLDNGKSIKVKVNDRGPFVRGRIIDVSVNAAKSLGFYGKGTAKVVVELDREASLALLKDPRLRMSEATKKQIVEAYTREDSPPSKSSQGSPSRLASAGQKKPVMETKLAARQSNQPSQPKPQEQEQQQQQQQIQTQLAQNSQQQMQPEENQEVTQEPEQELSQVASQSQTQERVQQPIQKSKKATHHAVKKPVKKPLLEAISSEAYAGTVEAETPAGAPTTSEPVKKSENVKSKSGYSIQIASTTSQEDAKKIITKLENLSSKIEQANVNGKRYFRIRLHGYNSENDAQLALNTIKSRGYKDAFIFKNTN